MKVWNTETKVYDEIELPTAASLITDFEIMGLWNGSEVTNGKTGTEETSADVLLSVFKHKVSEN